MKPRRIYRIGVVSDLHVGSIYGLMPPGFETSAGSVASLNIGQRYLWDCWTDARKRIGKLDALILNGDVIDGRQSRQGGSEFALPMLEDQSEAAVRSMRYFTATSGNRNVQIFCLQGTTYHDEEAGREMEVVAQRLSAVQYSGLGTGRYCKEVLDLTLDNVTLNFAHGISVSSGLYRATAPDREALWSALAGKEGRSLKADCVVRSHAHYFCHIEHPTKHAIITPCWELQTRYMRRNSVYRMMPDLGYVVIEVDCEAKRQGDDPCRIVKKLYPLPQPRAAIFRVA